jgi:hypothetical protein
MIAAKEDGQARRLDLDPSERRDSEGVLSKQTPF